MCSVLCLLLSAGITRGIWTQIPAKTRESLEKLGARMGAIMISIRQNTIKLAELKTDATLLQEKVNQAKDLNNRARLEKAFANVDAKRKACEDQIVHQQKVLSDLMTIRGLVSGASNAETVAERNAALGIEKPVRAPIDLPEKKSKGFVPVEDDEMDAEDYLPYVPHHKRK